MKQKQNKDCSFKKGLHCPRSTFPAQTHAFRSQSCTGWPPREHHTAISAGFLRQDPVTPPYSPVTFCEFYCHIICSPAHEKEWADIS